MSIKARALIASEEIFQNMLPNWTGFTPCSATIFSQFAMAEFVWLRGFRQSVKRKRAMNPQEVEMTHAVLRHAEYKWVLTKDGCEGQEVKQSEANAEETSAAKTR
jgi:hypothetical protein